MADSNKPPPYSSLDPTAASFTMSEQAAPPVYGISDVPSTQPLPTSLAKPQKQPKRPDKSGAKSATTEDAAETGAGVKLTGADLKKQKAAEKAARRAEKVTEKGAQAQAVAQLQNSSQPKLDLQRKPSVGKKEGENFHKRSGSMSGKQINNRSAGPTTEMKERPREEKRLEIVKDLYSKEKRSTIAGAGKEIHPAVLALGLQLRDYVICGGNARCVAMLLVFKKVIQAYTTPAGTALSRHLTTHLAHQISYLSHSRPLSFSQGNSIRWLKKLISALDPDLSDSSAKQFLCQSIDQFIREKITLADEMIQTEASSRISDGDVILTYAKSSIVEKTLLSAHRQGKKFKVVVVDSRPLFEGKNLARSLSDAGMEIQYSLLSGLADVVKIVTKCILGASAMMGNGRLYSRAGSAMVAMMAKDAGFNIPVIVLCESVKFTNKTPLDSTDLNELGDGNSLVEYERNETLTTTPVPTPAPSKNGKKSGKEENDSDESKKAKGLEGWKDQPNLYLLNLMYDVTPAEYLDMVITEMGSLPPSAVPVVNGVHGEEE
jgi:translation initiation factor eIF-2B subunit delta